MIKPRWIKMKNAKATVALQCDGVDNSVTLMSNNQQQWYTGIRLRRTSTLTLLFEEGILGWFELGL